VPDFFAAVAVVARTIGVSVGEVSCRLLALGPPPHAPTLAKLSAKDYGSSVGHVDDPNEAFKLDVFESDVDDLASTGLSTPDVTRGTTGRSSARRIRGRRSSARARASGV
jgi:hypothetical protein